MDTNTDGLRGFLIPIFSFYIIVVLNLIIILLLIYSSMPVKAQFIESIQMNQQQRIVHSPSQVYYSSYTSVVGIILPTTVSTGPNPDFDGTGFVFGKEGKTGWIVTADHVIGGNEAVDVVFHDGSRYTANVIGNDIDSDIGVLEVVNNSTQRMIPLTFGNSSSVKVGEHVLAIGYPFMGETLPSLATTGIVSASGLEIENVGEEGQSMIGAIVTDTPTLGGFSGGPLLNNKGEVIGMITIGDEGERCCDYAVPSNLIKKIASALIETGEYFHPWIGIIPVTLSGDYISNFGLPHNLKGIVVNTIDRDGPAHKAGIIGSIINEFGEEELGDIVTAINGHPITTADQFDLYIEEHTSVGETVQLSIYRNGSVENVSVTLEST